MPKRDRVNKTESLRIRVTKADKKAFSKAAKSSGMGLSKFMRTAAYASIIGGSSIAPDA